MKLLAYLARSLGVRGVAIVLLGLVGGVLNAAIVAWLTRQLSSPDRFSTSQAGWSLLLILVAVLTDISAKYLFLRMTAGVTSSLRKKLIQQILDCPYPRLEQLGGSRLLTALTEDIAKVGQSLGNMPTMLIAIVTTVGCVIYLACHSPLLMFATLLVGMLVGLLSVAAHLKARPLVREAFLSRDVLYGYCTALMAGIKELKQHASRRKALTESLIEPQLRQIENQVTTARLWNQISVTGSQASVFCIIVVILFSARWLAATPELLATFVVVMLYMKSAVHSVLSWLPTFAEADTAIASLERVGFSLAELSTTTGSNEPAPPLSTVQIQLSGVCFEYPSDHTERGFAIGPIDLAASSGEVIFVTGGNGSGKTTLMKLLSGLYRPTTGTIHMNGQVIAERDYHRYIEQFAVVFADYHLFPELISAESLRLELSQVLYDRLKLSSIVPQLSLPTIRPEQLSHGQRQRLALLVACLDNRPIFVFDEWAANQDPSFREVFYRDILPELKARGKLIFVVSHDNRYYEVADRHIEIADGRICTDRSARHPLLQTA